MSDNYRVKQQLHFINSHDQNFKKHFQRKNWINISLEGWYK